MGMPSWVYIRVVSLGIGCTQGLCIPANVTCHSGDRDHLGSRFGAGAGIRTDRSRSVKSIPVRIGRGQAPAPGSVVPSVLSEMSLLPAFDWPPLNPAG